MTGLLRDAVDQAAGILFPVDCAGCGAPDVAVCPPCRRALDPRPPFARRTPEGNEVWSSLVFGGVAAGVIRALKEDGRTGLARVLAPALAASVQEAGATTTVAVPTSYRAMRRRGFRPVELLARRAGCPLAPILSLRRTTGDQRGLGREDRRRNVAGSMRARPYTGDVIVVDDVVTTGATIDEAIRALRAAGIRVRGAATVAATPRVG